MLEAAKNIFRNAINRWRHRGYRQGRTLSRFIAKDVRREILIVSADELDDGFVTARIRTTNVLYLSSGLVTSEPFGPTVRIPVANLWDWTGQSWGGLNDGTSLVDHLRSNDTETSNDA